MIGVRLVPMSKYLRDYHGRNRPYKGQIVVGRVAPDLDASRLESLSLLQERAVLRLQLDEPIVQ